MLLQTYHVLKIQIPDVRACKVSRRSQAAHDPKRSFNPDFRTATYPRKANIDSTNVVTQLINEEDKVI